MQIPSNQSLVTDYDVFSAFDLSLPELGTIRSALESENIALAKQELIHYFETRKNTVYYYDCRKLPLMSIDTDSTPYVFQAALGLKGSLKDFCLYAGRKLMKHIYVRLVENWNYFWETVMNICRILAFMKIRERKAEAFWTFLSEDRFLNICQFFIMKRAIVKFWRNSAACIRLFSGHIR